MYSSYGFLPETNHIIKRIQSIVLSYDCTLAEIVQTTGISFGCLKHLLYGGCGTSESKEVCIVRNQGSAPRYDRVIRLLAGRYLPHGVLFVDEQLRDDLMDDLIKFCVTPLREISLKKLKRHSLSPSERIYFPSQKRVKAVANGKIPQLDFVVRLLKGKTISLDNLVPLICITDIDGMARNLFLKGLTEENTQEFFSALRALFLII